MILLLPIKKKVQVGLSLSIKVFRIRVKLKITNKNKKQKRNKTLQKTKESSLKYQSHRFFSLSPSSHDKQFLPTHRNLTFLIINKSRIFWHIEA